MKLKDIFQLEVTRDIPPVVYFHEQDPARLQDEVNEYIITGGYQEGHPQRERVPSGIHEQYVMLLNAMASELETSGGPSLPASWISGFFGSGKSSFAKLLGLALDGMALPDGRSLAEALLSRDVSPNTAKLREAYTRLHKQIDPISVVFDIGGVARDNEHIHWAVVRQVQKRLGYCTNELVALTELDMERDGKWAEFAAQAEKTLEKPWSEVRETAMAKEDFSHVMSDLNPERYTRPMEWLKSRKNAIKPNSVEDATRAISDMLRFRADGKTLFVVVDEVSQYVQNDDERMLKLQSFVSELGKRLKGRVWLLATGQEKLEQSVELQRMKDRFPDKLQVHLSATNIRDVVHQRLLGKNPAGAKAVREAFHKYRNDLKLFAFGCEDVTDTDFVEVYPMLPSQIDLVLQITTALRTRSKRSQGDDQAIRGLLQLLGELFRTLKLAERELGALVTLDQIYDIQHTALDSDVQTSMARVLAHCAEENLELGRRATKAVALLELIQDKTPTTAKLVASCLYDRMDRGNQVEAVEEALETLRRVNLLGYSEKQGYKVQSSAGEAWERDRREISVPLDDTNSYIQDALKILVATPDQPRLDGRKFPWRLLYSDGKRQNDVVLQESRDPACITVDFQCLKAADRGASVWVNQSNEKKYRDRIVWVVGDTDDLSQRAREFGRSARMVKKYKDVRQSLPHDQQRLLLEEMSRMEELQRDVVDAVASAWHQGDLFFRGEQHHARDQGGSAATALSSVAGDALKKMYSYFLPLQVSPSEVLQLVEVNFSTAPSRTFVDELQILSLDAGNYEATCQGVVPQRVLDYIAAERVVSGQTLLGYFGGPPYGYTADVVRACVAGLLRGSKIRIQPDAGSAISAVRDAGVREVFEKDRSFRKAEFSPAGEGGLGYTELAKIAKFFEKELRITVKREKDAIADGVENHFPAQARQLRELLEKQNRLPGRRKIPEELSKYQTALEKCMAKVRHTEPTVEMVFSKLDELRDGATRLATFQGELTDKRIEAVRRASQIEAHELLQLEDAGEFDEELSATAERVRAELSSETPWRTVGTLDDDLALITSRYHDARVHLMQSQTEEAEAIRQRVKVRDGFATLSADHSNHVLRPIKEAEIDTTADAISPPLIQLRDGYHRRLQEAEETAMNHLDALLSEGKDKPQIRRVPLQLRNREIRNEQELDALLAELKEKILTELKSGHVRLV